MSDDWQRHDVREEISEAEDARQNGVTRAGICVIGAEVGEPICDEVEELAERLGGTFRPEIVRPRSRVHAKRHSPSLRIVDELHDWRESGGELIDDGVAEVAEVDADQAGEDDEQDGGNDRAGADELGGLGRGPRCGRSRASS